MRWACEEGTVVRVARDPAVCELRASQSFGFPCTAGSRDILAAEQALPPRHMSLTLECSAGGKPPCILHLRSVGKAILHVGREAAQDPLRHFRREWRDVYVTLELARQDHLAVRLPEWRNAAQHVCDDGGQRETIRGGFLRLAKQLFGRRERRRARCTGG